MILHVSLTGVLTNDQWLNIKFLRTVRPPTCCHRSSNTYDFFIFMMDLHQIFYIYDGSTSNSDEFYVNIHNKYNNAKYSIPAHPTFVNGSHHDLRLWPVTSKIDRVHPLAMVNMSAKFDEEAHNVLVSIVLTSLFLYMSVMTFNLDLWHPKLIRFILSVWLTCLPSSMKKHTMV